MARAPGQGGSPGQAADQPLPPPPALGRAVRDGASDLFFNSWRVVPANVIFGGALLVALWVWLTIGAIPAAALAIFLAAPLAGLFRLGALATRGRMVSFTDSLDPIRTAPGPVLLAGLGFALVTLVLLTNVVAAILVGGIVLWAVGTAAAWGLLATFAFGFAFWPLALDPERADVPWRGRARLAALLVLAHPGRMGALTVVLTLILFLSSIAFAALLTVSVGYVALVACRYVLPAADRLEARLARPPGVPSAR